MTGLQVDWTTNTSEPRTDSLMETAISPSEKYKYAHSYANHWVQQQYLPDVLKDTKYYTFGDNKTEQAARAYWAKIKGEENV